MYGKTQIEPESYAAKLWKIMGKPLDELDEIMCGVVQETFIKELKPTKEQIYTWKASANGKSLLQAHIRQNTGKMVTSDTLEILWRYYTGRTVRNRNRRMVKRFALSVVGKKLCVHCGTTNGPFHIDHKVPLALGGSDTDNNLQILCETCNKRKGMRIDTKRPFVKLLEF